MGTNSLLETVSSGCGRNCSFFGFIFQPRRLMFHESDRKKQVQTSERKQSKEMPQIVNHHVCWPWHFVKEDHYLSASCMAM